MLLIFHFILFSILQREWQGGAGWRDDEKNGHVVVEPPPPPAPGLGKISEQKGILGPGPAELRFPEAV